MSKPLAIKNSQGVTYFLYWKFVSLRGGKKVPIYFFNKQSDLDGQNNCNAASELPEGYGYRENPRNHVLVPYRKQEGQAIQA